MSSSKGAPIKDKFIPPVTRPKYRRAYDHLYAEIQSGRLTSGQALPTEARLIESLGMSRNTVRQALAELENEGVIHRIQGRGTFVSTDDNLRTGAQLSIFALVAPQLREGLYPSLIHGFEEACAGFSHQALIGNSGNDIGRQADLIIQLVDQSVGGVAIVPTTEIVAPTHQIRLLQKHKIPVVFCHRPVEGVKAPLIGFRGQGTGLAVGRRLLEFGHRRIAQLFTHHYSMVGERKEGLQQAFLEAGIDPSGIIPVEYGYAGLLPGPHCEKALLKALPELLAMPDRPTAIFCGNAPEAEIVYLHAQAAGLEIPRDLSLIYFGGTLPAAGLAGRISTVEVAEHQIGARAVQLLREMRTGKRALDDVERIEFPVTLGNGRTLGPAPKGSL